MVMFTFTELNRILQSCKIINLEKHEEFPNSDEGIYVVGLTNIDWPGSKDCYECKLFYNVHYTDHNLNTNTYGGYSDKDKDGKLRFWWTMNCVYNDINNTKYAYIVDNEEDGEILAKFLSFINGYFDINNVEHKINNLEKQINDLQKQINVFIDIKNFIINNKYDTQY